MKPKVRWTSREWESLAQYFLDSGIDPDGYGFSRSLDNAQKKVLPAERHRAVKGIPAQLKKELKEHITALEYKGAFATPYPPPEDKPPSAESLSTEELLVELAKRMARVLDATRNVPPETTNSADLLVSCLRNGKHNPEPVHGQEHRKLRILVCGPNGDASQSLRTQFPNLDLRFYKYEENPANIPMKAQGCDAILCVTKFVTHAAADMIKATGIPFKMLTTVREAREWLTLQSKEGAIWATTSR